MGIGEGDGIAVIGLPACTQRSRCFYSWKLGSEAGRTYRWPGVNYIGFQSESVAARLRAADNEAFLCRLYVMSY